jgi:hypothetical protein
MRTFSDQELEKIIINESLITRITWVNHFADLVIQIDWCGQEDLKNEFNFMKIRSSLHFDFTTEVEFDFKFKPTNMGALEITTFTFEKKLNIWAIAFEFSFYPVGHIKFNCNDFRFVVEPTDAI